MTTPIKPEPLSLYTLHTPEVVKQWKAEMADYYQELASIENAEKIKDQDEYAHQNRILSEDEYFQVAVKRQKVIDDKASTTAVEAKKAALSEIDHRMSSPATVDVINRNEFAFIQEVIHWANRNYTLANDGFHSFVSGLYHIQMTAPANKKVGK